MNTVYISDIQMRIDGNEPITKGEEILLAAYRHAEHFRLQQITYAKEIEPESVPELITALQKAEVKEFYLTRLAGEDDLETILQMDLKGLRLKGIELLDNPAYTAEKKEWGESWQKPVIPALKFSFNIDNNEL